MTDHNVLTGTALHEPKGAESANAGDLYVSNGLGSGNWQPIATANEVIINSMSDFPTAVSGVRTLASGVRYVIGAALTTSDRFVLGQGTSITAFNINSPTVTYTGSGTMFSGVDVSIIIQDIKINCPNGEVFNFSDVAVLNSSIVLIKDVFILSAGKLGTFTSLVSLVITDTSCFNATQGYTLVGTGWRVWRFQDTGAISSNAAFEYIDFGVATCAGIVVDTVLFSAPAGAVAVKGAAASANVLAGSIARVNNIVVANAGDVLSGIDPDDARWVFEGNDQVRDTNPEAFAFMRSNAVATVIATVNTPVLVAGTWTAKSSSQFDITAAGRITYIGERDVRLPVSVSMTAETVSGTDKDVTLYLSKNGTVDNDTGQPNNVKVGQPGNTTLLWQDEWTTGDYCEVFIENNDDTVNILATDLKFVVN